MHSIPSSPPMKLAGMYLVADSSANISSLATLTAEISEPEQIADLTFTILSMKKLLKCRGKLSSSFMVGRDGTYEILGILLAVKRELFYHFWTV